MIGRTLGHYRIEAKLAEGGMGVVYKATDTHLDRPVALKVLRPDLVGDAERNRRFQQEAKAASALNHPNIVHIYDIASDGGVDFIAMEFVEGQTLDRVIGKGLKTGAALDYAIQVADALAAAHARGIVHRDIKPSNIIVNARGQVKVLDFGIAKLLRDEEQGSNTTRTVLPHTEQGVVIGTAAYMSPEQTEGREVGPPSDIFSFGAVLFEMLTGRRAFEGNTNLAIASAILHAEPPQLRELIPAVAPELERTVARCLRKDSSKRTQHMIDVKLALEELKDDTASARIAGARRGTWPWVAVAGIAALIGIPGFFIWQASESQEPEAAMTATPLTTMPGAERYPSLSPDGTKVAFAWAPTPMANADIYVQLIGSGEPLQLTSDPRSEFNPVWSPDGKTIAFLRADRQPVESSAAGRVELLVIPALRGTEHKLADLEIAKVYSRPAFLAWCPDGDCLIATNSPGTQQPDALFAFALETGEGRQLTHSTGSVIGDNNPAVSPDGRWLAFRRSAGGSTGEIYAVPLSGERKAAGDPISIVHEVADGAFPAWMPDSNEIIFSSQGHLWRIGVPATGPPAQLPFVGDGGLMPTVARVRDSGATRLVYVRASTDLNIWRVDMAAPGQAGTVSAIPKMASTLADFPGDISPDKKRVAFVSDRSGARQIWLSDIDGTKLRQLTSIDGGAIAPRWSPDGKLIAFQANNVRGNTEVYTIPADGGRPLVLASHQANDNVPSFSRDGKSIYFGSMRSSNYEIWKVATDGGDPVRVTKTGGFKAFEAATGGDLFFRTNGGAQIFKTAVNGSREPVELFSGVSNGGFDVVDQGIYFVGETSGRFQLRFYDLARKTIAVCVNDLGPVGLGMIAASRDGRIVLFPRQDSVANDLMLVENFK